MELIFEWDVKKAELNFHKHRVTFDEAKTVFYNPLAKIFNDEIHSIKERREIIIGHSNQGRLLLVVFTEKKENLIRIINSRVATKNERRNYEENIDKKK